MLVFVRNILFEILILKSYWKGNPDNDKFCRKLQITTRYGKGLQIQNDSKEEDSSLNPSCVFDLEHTIIARDCATSIDYL